MSQHRFFVFVLFLTLLSGEASFAEEASHWLKIPTLSRDERTLIESLGASIEVVSKDFVIALAESRAEKRLKQAGFQIEVQNDPQVPFDFPPADSRFHDYARTVSALLALESANPGLAKVVSIGKSIEGRDLLAIHINTDPNDLAGHLSSKPGMLYLGTHHAREHLSTEMPLMLAEYLLNQKANPIIAPLLQSRDIWIVPLVNPDGSEYDISGGQYKSWRKNRAHNFDGSFGVDLNRNYGFRWGTGGSSDDPTSEVFKGPNAFSEPETQAVKAFIDSHLNLKMLLTYHTFSELILYPWGHDDKAIPNVTDRSIFTTLAQNMAAWNHYRPMQSSNLYIASGDTTDWAYGAHGIFAFTFELSPKDQWQGGFYPGAAVIDRVFQDNLQPSLYLLNFSDDPSRVLRAPLVKTFEDSFGMFLKF